jgi:hypothetical protein
MEGHLCLLSPRPLLLLPGAYFTNQMSLHCSRLYYLYLSINSYTSK